jgi:FtsH-binding integral membrane protein
MLILIPIHTGFIYSLFGAVLFSLYIVFDTYMLMEKLDYSEWLLASISLYLVSFCVRFFPSVMWIFNGLLPCEHICSYIALTFIKPFFLFSLCFETK